MEPRIGYMCKVDFEFELGQSAGPSRIYGSLDEMKEQCKCADGCGIVEVEVSLKRVVQEGSF